MPTQSTYGLRYEQLMKLLAAASPKSAECDDPDEEALAAHIQSHLTGPLEEGLPLVDHLLSAMEQTDIDTKRIKCQSVCDVLLDPESPMELLGKVKLAGKQMSYIDIVETERALGVVVYYGALAAALVHHGEKMTQSGWRKLEQAFATLADKHWMPSKLSGLFGRAKEFCRQQKEP